MPASLLRSLWSDRPIPMDAVPDERLQWKGYRQRSRTALPLANAAHPIITGTTIILHPRQTYVLRP